MTLEDQAWLRFAEVFRRNHRKKRSLSLRESMRFDDHHSHTCALTVPTFGDRYPAVTVVINKLRTDQILAGIDADTLDPRLASNQVCNCTTRLVVGPILAYVSAGRLQISDSSCERIFDSTKQ